MFRKLNLSKASHILITLLFNFLGYLLISYPFDWFRDRPFEWGSNILTATFFALMITFIQTAMYRSRNVSTYYLTDGQLSLLVQYLEQNGYRLADDESMGEKMVYRDDKKQVIKLNKTVNRWKAKVPRHLEEEVSALLQLPEAPPEESFG